MKNQEALRCLLCKKPKCSLEGCPVHTDIPACIRLYREDRLEEAGEILFQNNPLSAITAQVCDWKQFCYGHCVLNVKQAPIPWYQMEQEISAAYLRSAKLSRKSETLKGRRIALVGAGPVGIAAAVWLYQAGAEVSLYDANERIGGVLRYGIPAFRLSRDLIDAYERLFSEAGIVFHGHTHIGKDLSLKELSDSHDAVLIGAGAEKPATLRIPGEERAIQALPFLKDPGAFRLGRKAIVIGGGNVAMDACRTAIRQGVETWVYYRKTFENMPANPLEVEEAKADGVQFRVFQAPVEVKEGGVVFRDCENTTDPESGKLVTRILDGTDHFVPCDTLITAISEKPDFSLFNGFEPAWNQWHWPDTDPSGKVIGLPNIYVAGDFILGPKTVVEAVASAKAAVEALQNQLAR